MAFEGLSEKLQAFTKKLRGKARINETELTEMLREVKLALLEADVNYKVVKEFINDIHDKALGQDVLKSLTPGQQVVKIVNEALVELLGGTDSKIAFSNNPPTVIMLVGLQGSGKTTTAGKLANLLRTAAIKQLEVVGSQLGIPVYSNEGEKDVVKIAKQSKEIAIKKLCDTIILDTAGRLQIDETLMQELKDLKTNLRPHEIMLVVDSMIGQESVNIASKFNEDLGIDGVILTKLDGDTRGGAAISIKKVTGKPIKYIGTGEKLNEIEEFHPDRMASRILGMGDVLTLIEQAQEQFDAEEAEKLEKKFRKNKDFDLNDYLTQMKQIKKLGSISSLLKKIPGFGQYSDQVSDKELDKITAVIQSMTEQERTNPKILNASRRIRIANGSGTSVQFINKFMKTFEQMQTMMKQMRGGKPNPLMKKMMKSMNLNGLSEKDLEDFENKLK